MRTAVIRVNVDPQGVLDRAQLERGVSAVRVAAAEAGMTLVHDDLVAQPARRRELEFLAQGEDTPALQEAAAHLCRRAFDTAPVNGTTTYLSRGTDDDAVGVLAGFGLDAELLRTPGPDGWDIVTVRLAEADLRRVPESRIQTALEASLNCEVQIETR